MRSALRPPSARTEKNRPVTPDTLPQSDATAAYDPLAEYNARLAARQEASESLALKDRVLGNMRLATFVAGLFLFWAIREHDRLTPWLMALPLTLFVILLVVHDRVIGALRLAERAVAFYRQGVARLTERWSGSGSSGERYAEEPHLYAGDLDLFGTGSLFELLCTARTQAGEECLADWLRTPTKPEVVRQRQNAVAELRPRLDFREEIALLGEEVQAGIQYAALIRWGKEAPLLSTGSVRRTAAALTAMTAAAAVAWAMGAGPWPFLLLFALEQVWAQTVRRAVRKIAFGASRPGRELELLALLLARIEQERFDTRYLRLVRKRLEQQGEPPSRRIARLRLFLDYLQMQYNQFFAPIALLLLWDVQCTCAIEAWRIANGGRIAEWIAAVGEFEALNALSGYAYEHPEDPFPEIREEELLLDAVQLCHPLLPVRTAVPNDVRLDSATRMLIVSGSNMSGKSTLLRTVGINVVLAFAGAPVRAEQFRLSSFMPGASLRTQDSLQSGVSRFYAEITRLREIVAHAEADPPVLFLLDEILHGTNSHDRRIGAEAVLRSLLRLGAVGLVTTHDLALAAIADDPEICGRNVHFEDHLEDGRMTFDYLLRPGVVRKSNALALMRAVGLHV